MSKYEKLDAIVAELSEEQVDAVVSFARSMTAEPYFDRASPEALASIERGLAQVAQADTVPLSELAQRLAKAARAK